MRTTNRKYSALIILLTSVCLSSFSQTFDLQKLVIESKLITYGRSLTLLNDSKKGAISSKGVVWIKGLNFTNGTIEIDLRGKDIPQQSFLGIAFHGVDTITYVAVYFRPFNFQAKDSVRKIHAVQYVSEPEYPWHRLREEKNGVYEKVISPPPSPTEWFHARIVVKGSTITVYVNNSTTPSLTVDKINSRKEGLIGLWSFGLNGEFANLVVKNN